MTTKEKTIWECAECGHTQNKWAGSCGRCNQWNSLVQEQQFREKKRFETKSETKSKPVRISEVSTASFERLQSGIGEFDRLMGSGVVKGSLSLIAGNPGIGKSTLMIQVAYQFAKAGNIVLYICGEESVEQTSLRARRLGIDHDNLYLLSETSFRAIQKEIKSIKPTLLIVDSVQIMYKDDLPSAPGSVVQVREITMEFLHLSKGEGITTFLIGHVTKSGEIAGPRVLEHIVDTVLEFEGDRHHGFRLLRGVKNRFGSTDDIAIFQMKENGLEEVENPSQVFLEDRSKETAGSSIGCALEGGRSFLIEVQALVTSSSFSSPSRRSAGLDQNRLALLLAVLEKRIGYRLYNSDVFVSLAGGMRISEPALDLAILAALASSFVNQRIDAHTLILGEVGLGGEVRAVPRIETRLKEGIHLGFKRAIMPKRNLKNLAPKFREQIELIGVEVVDDAIKKLFN